MAEAPKVFVCGHPIGHSRSPIIHRYWLEEFRIPGSYEAIDVAPEDFAAFLASLRARGFAGGNVTIPHKESAFRTAGRLDEAAEEIGAVNTLWFEDGLLCATNTDAHGFAANLDDQAMGWDRGGGAALVLGAGGASKAIIYALRQRGFSDIRIVNRTPERATQLADRFGKVVSAHPMEAIGDLLRDATILINTTPLGMAGQNNLAIDLDRLPTHSLVTDIVYVPMETPLLAAAHARGLRTADGLGMLLHQAVPGFERWFGARPEVTASLRAKVVADLAAG